MSTADESAAWFSSTSFRFRPKSPEVFERARALTQSYEAMSAAERLELQSALRGVSSKLLALSGYIAEVAISERDESWIRAGIVLHVIEDFSVDYRNNTRFLVLISHAAKALSVNLSDICSSVSPIASQRARNSLEGFLGRDESLNRLQGIGIKTEIVDRKLRFVPIR
jgi:hypothetical protein